jgi:hypothetical protein
MDRRGFGRTSYFDVDQPTTRAHEWNLILEREVLENTVVRAGYVGTHGSRLDQFYNYNDSPNDYVWFSNTGLPIPTGEFAGVARRNFPTQPYGPIEVYRKIGWSNYSGVQLEVQRRYSRGYGFQVFYVMSNAFRAAGDGWSSDLLTAPNLFLKGAVPEDLSERNRFLTYKRDIEIPQHRLRWNWIADLPFGRGKRFGGNAGGALDRVIGGCQIAGFGSMRSNYWTLPTGNWGALGPVEIYGKKYPIEDCRSGVCFQGYLWYNGYIPANRINSVGADGRPNGVMGVPSSYRPAHMPVNPQPAPGQTAPYPASDYDTNRVDVRLNNGSVQRINMDTNLHPWRNQYLPGPRTWGLDASLFKHTRINEQFVLRLNVDFFNVLNMPGLQQPDANTGIVSLRNSANSPRNLAANAAADVVRDAFISQVLTCSSSV